MLNLKKAALCLYGLHEDDQKKLLKELPEDKVKQLSGMLKELETRNMPRVQQIIPSFDDCMTEFYEKSRINTGELETQIKLIEAATLQDICDVLVNENENYIAMLIRLHEWSWTGEYMKTLHIKKRNQINVYINAVSGVYPERMKYVALKLFSESIYADAAHDVAGID